MTVTLALAEGTSIVTESILKTALNMWMSSARMGGSIKVEGNVAIIGGVDGFTEPRSMHRIFVPGQLW